jgi:hypothetical protein
MREGENLSSHRIFMENWVDPGEGVIRCSNFGA